MLDSDFLLKSNNNMKMNGGWIAVSCMKWTQTSLLFLKSCGVIFLLGFFYIPLENKNAFSISRPKARLCRLGKLVILI
tara:strand:- start:2040 stop:2273 length:234 start_codon:yes stop_codon:yes gene_type:complete